jgi:hypothetical protein
VSKKNDDSKDAAPEAKLDSLDKLNTKIEGELQEPAPTMLSRIGDVFTSSYGGGHRGTAVRATLIFLVLGWVTMYLLDVGPEESDGVVSTTVERKGTQIEKDAALLTEAQRERIEGDVSSEYDKAVKKDNNYIPSRHSLINSAQALSDKKKKHKQRFVEIYKQMIADGMDEASARVAAVKQLVKELIAGGMTADEAVQAALEAVYRDAYDGAISQSLTRKESKGVAAKTTYEMAKQIPLTEVDAIRGTVKAAYCVAYGRAKIAGRTDEESIDAAANEAYRAGITLGLSKKESRVTTLSSAVYCIEATARAEGKSEDEIKRIVAKASFLTAKALSLSGDNATQATIDAIYNKAFQEALDAGMSEAEARKKAANEAYNAGISIGMSEDEARAAANIAALKISKNKELTKEEIAKNAYQLAYERAIAQGKSKEEARRLAAIAAYKAAVEAGISPEEARQMVLQEAYSFAYKEEFVLTSDRDTSSGAGAKSAFTASRSLSVVDLTGKLLISNIAYQYGLTNSEGDKYLFAAEDGYSANIKIDSDSSLALKRTSKAAFRVSLQSKKPILISSMISGRAAYITSVKMDLEQDPSLFNGALFAYENGMDEKLSQSHAVLSSLTVVYDEEIRKEKSKEVSIKKAIEIVLEMLVSKGLTVREALSLIGPHAITLAGDATLMVLKNVALANGYSNEEANQLVLESVRQSAINAGKRPRDALIEALKAAKKMNLSKEEIDSFFNKIISDRGFSEEQEARLRDELSAYLGVSAAATVEVVEIDDKEARMKKLMMDIIDAEKERKKNDRTKDDDVIVSGVSSIIEIEEDESKDVEPENQRSPTQVTEEAGGADRSENKILAIEAGYFTYAIVATNINTDISRKEVLAIIGGGPLDGARAIGTYDEPNQWGENVSIVFDRIMYKGYEISSVELVAFDNVTHLPAIVDEVDRHYFTRFGALVVKGLSLGYQAKVEAERQVSTSTSSDGVGQRETKEPVSSSQGTALMLAAVGQELGSRADDYFLRPITKKVFAGKEIKLLALSNIYMPEELAGDK